MVKQSRGTCEEDKCPTDDFKVGEPKGKCWGDGHYDCKNCTHYREDFKRLGQEYIDFIHTVNKGIVISYNEKKIRPLI